MSFKSPNKKLKSFVTEDEASEIDAKKQEQWEKLRGPDDPLERPPDDNRCLFDQLQAQKEKTQQAHEEKYSLKNMIRGIDNDEATFLEFACQQQAEMDGRRFKVTSEIKEFRSEVAQLQATITTSSDNSNNDIKEKKKSPVVLTNKKSQLALIAGGIKTKRKRSSETSGGELTRSNSESETGCSEKVADEPIQKKLYSSSTDNNIAASTLAKGENDNSPERKTDLTTNVGYCRGASDYKPRSIPSLGVYSDSSDSESSTSDSEILPSVFSVSSKRN